MTRLFDTVVIGGDIDALVAAIEIAGSGSKVLLVTEEVELGGCLRQVEFAPGFRAAPLGRDLGWVPAQILELAGLSSVARHEADPAVIAFGEGPPLLLRRSVSDTSVCIGALSRTDAQKWPEFCRRLRCMAGFLEELYRHPAPRIGAQSPADLLALAQLARGFRSLRRAGMEELLRTIPMAISDLLDDWFESPLLKGALAAIAVRDLCQGPMGGGTAFNLLHQLAGAAEGIFGERLVVAGGAGLVIDALARKARDAGVTIQTQLGTQGLLVGDGSIRAVQLANGEEIACREVISASDPYRTLLQLIDPRHLEVETIQCLRRVRYRGVTSVVLLALERLPPLPRLPGPPTGIFVFAPTIAAVERAYDAVKYGACSEQPVVEMHFPSFADPALAPVGKHVAILHVQYTPYALGDRQWDAATRESVGARALQVIEGRLPGFGACVSAGQVLAPPDLATLFGLREGAVSRAEMGLDQVLFMRPIPGSARYATPIDGLFLCGAGTHPGPGVAGVSGRLAARRLLSWRKRR